MGTHSEGMVLVVAVLCSVLRGARSTHSKAVALRLLSDASALCDDDTKLQVIRPPGGALREALEACVLTWR